MSRILNRLKQALAASDMETAVEAAMALDVELVLNDPRTPEVYSSLLDTLKALPQPQSRIGQTLVNLFQWHRKHVPPDVLADVRAFCEAASEKFIDAGAHQAMVELVEWPGHADASDV